MANEVLSAALIGNPNCGKSTLFNALTGLNQKVGNFPGVTVDRKVGSFKAGERKVNVVDLPGTYSLEPRSLDERVASQAITDPDDPDHPDLCLVVVDATHLKLGLYLVMQVLETGMPAILVLNMIDQLESQGLTVDTEALSAELSIPVLTTNARKGHGIEALREAMARHGLERPQAKWRIDHGSDDAPLERHAVIREILKKVLTGDVSLSVPWAQRIDAVLTHHLWGPIIFLGILTVVFQSIFSWAVYPMDWIETLFAKGAGLWRNVMPAGFLTDLWVEGIWAGLGGVVIFIPQIAFLFLFVALMEDTGYMARVSFITDRALRRFGLQGRSVVPLMGGVACAVPAILATRTISNWKERLITILVLPFMTCSARLPVYVLLISLVIPEGYLLGMFGYQGLTMLGMYVLGTATALGAALVVSKFIPDDTSGHFIMEMPVYRVPRWGNIGMDILRKVSMFVTHAGRIIVVISVFLWLGASFGPSEGFKEIEQRYDTLGNAPGADAGELDRLRNAELLESSYIGMLGHAIEPAIAPLGYDWKIGIALITSFAAREVFVGTMATIYAVGDSDDTATVHERMAARTRPNSTEPLYDLPFGLSLLVFYAFAMQCVSTLAVVRSETGSWKWPVFQLVGMTGFAYVCALTVYNLAQLLMVK
ncbi:MAG: ferrous iron transporter B [Flavobacteriales bacterium]|nr:ferrous iron transporter B [Flavobacteriales bacterium]